MMLKALLGLAALLGVSAAEPIRAKRQSGCVDAFQNVPNVCQNNPTGQLFFAHPRDETKFMQCDVYSRMFIIQCPAGEVFVAQSSGCQPRNSPTQPPAPVTTTTTTTTRRPIIYTQPPTQPQAVPGTTGNNPCTPEGTARGQLYYPFPNDPSKFYECDLQGNPSVLTCPQGLVWDQSVLSCVYPVDATNPQSAITPTQTAASAGLAGGNPCTAQAVSSGRLFFPHPDANKFIQCDLWGNFFVNDCPANLVWNAYLETCYSSFLLATAGKK